MTSSNVRGASQMSGRQSADWAAATVGCSPLSDGFSYFMTVAKSCSEVDLKQTKHGPD